MGEGSGRRVHPFRELREREHITLAFDPVADEAGGAIYARRGARAVIILSPDLDQVEREDSLAHELEHDTLGVVSPPATHATMERVENMAERRTTAWLVPPDELLAFVAARSEVEPITAAVVAEEFQVTEARALAALAHLQGLLLEREMARSASHGSSHAWAPTDAPGCDDPEG